MKKMLHFSMLPILLTFAGVQMNAQNVTVTSTSGSSTTANYATLAEAITAINGGTIHTGTIVCGVNSDVYTAETAPAGGYEITATGTAANPITFKKLGSGVNPTFTASSSLVAGSLNDAIFKIIGGDYITIDGFTMRENPANTVFATAATNNMTEFGVALLLASTTNGAQNNTVQNCVISLDRTYRNTFGIYANARHTASDVITVAEAASPAGSNSNNKFYSNTISNVNLGVALVGANLAANMDSGNDAGGASAATGNTFTNWGGNSVLSAYPNLIGNSLGIYAVNQTGENVSYNSLSTVMVSPVTIFGILKFYSSATAQPTGTFTSNYNNNTVSIANTPTVATAGTVVGVSSQGLTPLLSTATINLNNNVIQNSSVGGSVSTVNGISGVVNSSAAGTVSISGNSFINNAITATTSTTGIIAGVSNSGAAGTVIMNNNIVRNLSTSSSTGQVQGVISSGVVTTAVTLNNNQLGNADGGFFTATSASSGSVFGVLAQGLLPAATLNIQNNDIRGIVYNVASTAPQNYINYSHAAVGTDNITGNTFTNLNLNTTGSVVFIARAGSLAATGIENVNNNSIVTGFNKAGAGGTITLFSANASSVNGSVMNQTGNNFSNITFTGATTMTGWSNTEGASSTNGPAKNISNNTFANWTGGTAAITVLASNFGNANTAIAGNKIEAITGAAAVTGISVGGSNGGVQSVSGNTISGLSSSTTSTTTTVNVTGMLFAGGAAQNVFKNKIYNISATGAVTVANKAVGISVTGVPLAFSVYNNIVGKITAPNANVDDAVRGISITGTTGLSTTKLYYNSVYLDGASTGADFGSSALYHTYSATATSSSLDSRNNIFINNSTPNGIGSAVAFKRSAATDLANYAATSDNNIYYAGTPGANNLIYFDTVNKDQTLAAFKTRVDARDAASQTENTPFISTTGADADFLRIAAGATTKAESGAQTIAGIADDYFGVARPFPSPINGGNATDIGASEFDGNRPILAVSNTVKENVIVYKNGQDFTVKSAAGKIANLQVFESTGRVLMNLQPNAEVVSIPASRLGNGVFILQITLDNAVKTVLKIRK